MRYPRPTPQRSRRPAPVAGHAGAENYTSARLPQTPRVPSPPSPPACPGRDRLMGLAYLNLDLPRGTGAASPEKAFSSARATAEWGERARRELQQVSLALSSVPCPGTAVICAPHRTQPHRLPATPRPLSRQPIPRPAPPPRRGGAWKDDAAFQDVAPTPTRSRS